MKIVQKNDDASPARKWLGRLPRWVVPVASVVVLAVLVSLFTFGPLGPSARQRRLQDRALGLYTAMMTAWVADEPNDWPAGYVADYLDPYLADPARGTMEMARIGVVGYGGSVVASGTPYFAVTRSARLVDPAEHANASIGLTICWVQGNLTVTKVAVNDLVTVSGPGPSGHVAQVFFRTTSGRGRTSAANVLKLRIYDIIDITPADGTCPLD